MAHHRHVLYTTSSPLTHRTMDPYASSDFNSEEDDAKLRLYAKRHKLRRRSKSEIRLCEFGNEVDEYELFLAQAGSRKLSNSSEFGGSLPCFQNNLRSARPENKLLSKLSNTSRTNLKCFGNPGTSKIMNTIRNMLKDGDDSSVYREKQKVSRVNSAPSSRQTSFKKIPLQKSYSTAIRPRTSSVPSKKHFPRPSTLDLTQSGAETFEGWYKVRHFEVTPRGIVNRGDSFKSSSIRSLGSCGSCSAPGSVASLSSHSVTPLYKVLILGAQRVGKTTLSQQFRTSETMGAIDTDSDNHGDTCVTVMLDEEEIILDVVDLKESENFRDQHDVEAYVVLFSIDDKDSFRYAVDLLFDIRMGLKKVESIILVANKVDLVRCRQVSIKEAKAVAETYDCKYAEVSAMLNLQVDDLLGGMIRQIQLQHSIPRNGHSPTKAFQTDHPRVCRTVIGRLFRKQHSVSKSCDNLLV